MYTKLSSISCIKLTGVGPKTEARLENINLFTAQDLIFHLPFRYEDRTTITPIRELKPNVPALIVGTICTTEILRGRKPTLLCLIQDESGYLKIRFFNYAKQKLQFLLVPDAKIFCYGEINWVGNSLEMVHPEFRILAKDQAPLISKTLTPVYPTTDGLSQLTLRKLIDQALKILEHHENKTQEYQFLEFVAALNYLHHPPKDEANKHAMQQHLIFEELLAQQLSLLKLRQQTQHHAAPKITWDKNQKIAPFILTNAQERVIQEIMQDLQKPVPMLRLVQGDVGCGKTIVAANAILQVVKHDYQAAIMAPTEILAEQHFVNLKIWLEPLGISVILLTGKIKGKSRDKTTAAIASGEIKVIVGTHALFQEKINFAHLALAVIDEQHRFGVHQRLALREKGLKNGLYPHQLIMTATPIPRTLTMSIYADLDCSVIDELPKGRPPVKTIVVANKRRAEIITHVRENCRDKKQAYWVCPLIEESEILQCQAAETLAKQLTTQLPELQIGLIHGRMKSEEKDRIMTAFKLGKIDLLVATTVIEVGVDVPNASLMIIENAERLGLVQIHQLRGRIGRGTIASFCVLLYQTPLSQQARERLSILRDTHDGFIIAQKDLELRGPGEFLGTRQTGILQMRIADLLRDQHLIPEVQKTALSLLQHNPDIVETLIHRWLVPNEKYGAV